MNALTLTTRWLAPRGRVRIRNFRATNPTLTSTSSISSGTAERRGWKRRRPPTRT